MTRIVLPSHPVGLTKPEFETLRRVLRFHCARLEIPVDSPEAAKLGRQLVQKMLEGTRDEAALLDSL